MRRQLRRTGNRPCSGASVAVVLLVALRLWGVLFGVSLGEAAPAPGEDWYGHWAEAEIAYAFRKGIVTGYPDGQFRPDAPCSRTELVVLLLRALGKTEDALGMARLGSPFSDLPTTYWGYGYLLLAHSWGLVTAVNGSVLRDREVTRAEMVVMVWQVLLKMGLDTPSGRSDALPFSDAQRVPSHAREALLSLYEMGVVRGDDAGAFRPDAPLSRAEAVVVSARVLALLGMRWDLEGLVLHSETSAVTLVLDNGIEEVTLEFDPRFSVVYANGRRTSMRDVSVGSWVGVVLENGSLPVISYLLVVPR